MATWKGHGHVLFSMFPARIILVLGNWDTGTTAYLRAIRRQRVRVLQKLCVLQKSATHGEEWTKLSLTDRRAQLKSISYAHRITNWFIYDVFNPATIAAGWWLSWFLISDVCCLIPPTALYVRLCLPFSRCPPAISSWPACRRMSSVHFKWPTNALVASSLHRHWNPNPRPDPDPQSPFHTPLAAIPAKSRHCTGQKRKLIPLIPAQIYSYPALGGLSLDFRFNIIEQSL